MAARMISLLRFKGRRVRGRGWRGAACLMFMVSPLSPWWSWLCCGASAQLRRAAVLLPMALTLGRRRSPVHTTGVRRAPQSGGWFPTCQPITPRTSGDGPHMVSSSVPCDHETEDATQSCGRDEERAPQLTRTDPHGPSSRTGQEAECGSGDPF